MVTRGYVAFRYNGRFYRRYVNGDAYNDTLGQDLANRIPRDPVIRESSYGSFTLLDEICLRVRCGGDYQDDWDSSDDDGDPHDSLDEALSGSSDSGSRTSAESLNDPSDDFWDNSWGDEYEKPRFSEIVEDNVWLTFEHDCMQTFVFDLDCRAFTLEGRFHFNMDNMPPPDPNIADYLEEDNAIPVEHLATVFYWPKPDPELEKVSSKYEVYNLSIMALHDWAAPTWQSLSVPQRLSLDLAKSIISDFTKILAHASLTINIGKIIIICWRIVCATAPSYLFSHARPVNHYDGILYTSTRMHKLGMGDDDEPNYTAEEAKRLFYPRLCVEIDYEVQPVSRPFCRFRNCLFKFCLRLDGDTYLKAEIVQMVDQLKRNGRTAGVGVLMSSCQLVAVAIDGCGARRSPILEFHDNKGNMQDGLLLLVHLLSPAFTVHRTPWAQVGFVASHGSSVTLPEDVLRHILRFTDEETYHFSLPFVSHLVRSICLSRPRVGDFILNYVNSDGSYQALPASGPSAERQVKLVRKGKRAKKELDYSFLTHQTGTGPGTNEYMARLEASDETYERDVPWDNLVKGDVVPSMRVLAVDGAWAVEDTS
ncbi:hypothetical protein RhiJN_16459 [Ceratobasidium sp. AG-Ba]|nr:hypothetical protein RhiJN_16459 [Ceratobasidium sp. AG-Ba]